MFFFILIVYGCMFDEFPAGFSRERLIEANISENRRLEHLFPAYRVDRCL